MTDSKTVTDLAAIVSALEGNQRSLVQRVATVERAIEQATPAAPAPDMFTHYVNGRKTPNPEPRAANCHDHVCYRCAQHEAHILDKAAEISRLVDEVNELRAFRDEISEMLARATT